MRQELSKQGGAQQERLPHPEQSGEQGPFEGYSEKELSLSSYAAFVGVYGAAFAGFQLAAKRLDRELPERLSLGDTVLLGVATHKLSRIMAKDWVTSPLRAPFTEYLEPQAAGEVSEKPRGEGLQRALGELLTCPWCMGPWAAAALGYGFVLAPRSTRLVGSILAGVAMSDFLHHVYESTKNLSK